MAAALVFVAAGCGGSSEAEESASDALSEDGDATEVELFEIPSPEPSPDEDPDGEGADDSGAEADDATDNSSEDTGSDSDDDQAEPEPESAGPIVWRHVEGFDLLFENGRPDLTAAVDTFYAVGDGDINVSVDNILDDIDHERSWQDAADAAVATFPEGLGEASGIFALLSTQWAVIGCESHWAGMNQGTWNTHLFDHLVGEASGLPADQADNQAGTILAATNAAIATLCPRLLPA